MLFNTPQFVLFFLSLLLTYYCLPRVLRKYVILGVSFWFSYSIGGVSTVAFLGATILVSYLAGIILEKTERKRAVLAIALVLEVLVLAYGKYLLFLLRIIGREELVQAKGLHVVID